MDPQALRDLQQRLQILERRSARLRRGVVTATGPLEVALGGSDTAYTDVTSVASGLAVDDQVAVLVAGGDLLVLGVVQ